MAVWFFRLWLLLLSFCICIGSSRCRGQLKMVIFGCTAGSWMWRCRSIEWKRVSDRSFVLSRNRLISYAICSSGLSASVDWNRTHAHTHTHWVRNGVRRNNRIKYVYALANYFGGLCDDLFRIDALNYAYCTHTAHTSIYSIFFSHCIYFSFFFHLEMPIVELSDEVNRSHQNRRSMIEVRQTAKTALNLWPIHFPSMKNANTAASVERVCVCRWILDCRSTAYENGQGIKYVALATRGRYSTCGSVGSTD